MIRSVNASRKNIGLPLVKRAARLSECRGYACLSGEAYEVRTGYIARWSEEGSNALHMNNSILEKIEGYNLHNWVY